MPCYHPLPAWVAKRRNASGKRSVVFKFADGFKDRPVDLPCGRCIGCRLERARQWAVRCMHEASLYDANCFLTLTYSPENVPDKGSLRPEDMVKFLKRLRAKFGKVRFFQCGEYGENFQRPHHHVLLFGFEFPDRVVHSVRDGMTLYRSAELEKLWPFGFCTIGAVTFESAGYVARYSMKKVTGPGADAHYRGRVPEYLTMSRRPGIGRGWIEKFSSDVYPSDELVVRGHVCKPPKYYDGVQEKADPVGMKELREARKLAKVSDPESSGRRLVVRERVKKASISNLRREL